MRVLFSLFLMFFMIGASAQQEEQFTMHMMNKYEMNAAYAGLDFSLSANATYRNQWEGIQGSTRNLHVNAHMPYYPLNGAVGAVMERKSQGALIKTSLAGSYNYVMDNQFGLFSFGGRLGLSHLSIDGSKIITPEGDYTGLPSHNDPILLENQDSGLGIRWEVAGYFYNNTIETGVSFQQFPTLKIGLEQFSFDQITHANIFFQYNFQVYENIVLMQSILLKTDFNQIQSDISSLFKINGNIFGGINMRGFNSTSIDAFSLIGGMEINENYTLSYSYDVGVSGIRRVNDGTHEILLNYNLRKFLGKRQSPKIIYNPRYL